MLVHCPGGRSGSEGAVEKVSAEESDAYWAMRPRGSQIAASVSRQSEPIRSREALEARFAELDASNPGEMRALRTGAAIGSCPTFMSSGSTRRTACTTASATGGKVTAGDGTTAAVTTVQA